MFRKIITKRFCVLMVFYDEKLRKFKIPPEWDVSEGTAKERLEIMWQAAKNLGDKIKDHFPEVEIGEVSYTGLYIKISMSKKEIKNLVEKIKSEIGCSVIDIVDTKKIIEGH